MCIICELEQLNTPPAIMERAAGLINATLLMLDVINANGPRIDPAAISAVAKVLPQIMAACVHGGEQSKPAAIKVQHLTVLPNGKARFDGPLDPEDLAAILPTLKAMGLELETADNAVPPDSELH